MDIKEKLERIKSGSLSAEENVEQCIETIEKKEQPEIRAFIDIYIDDARNAAKQIDAKLKKGEHAGKRMMISTEVTNSVHEKGTLHKLMLGGYGIDLKNLIDEEGEVDLESLIVGKPVRIVVKHSTSSKNGKNYANIDSLMKVSTKSAKLEMETTEYKISEYTQTLINQQIPEDVLKKANPQLNWAN